MLGLVLASGWTDVGFDDDLRLWRGQWVNCEHGYLCSGSGKSMLKDTWFQQSQIPSEGDIRIVKGARGCFVVMNSMDGIVSM